MKVMSLSREGQDPFVNAVLDGIWVISEVDPTSVSPDERLMKDLGLTQLQVRKVIDFAANAMKLAIGGDFPKTQDLSAREIVNHLRARAQFDQRQSA